MQRVAGNGRATEDGFWKRRHAAIVMQGTVLGLAGCQGPLSVLDPAGPSADAIARLWWWMFGVGALAFVVTVGAWLAAMRRRPAADEAAAQRVGRRWILAGGVLMPSVSIVALLVFGLPVGFHQLPLAGREPAGGPPLRIDAIGRQWAWELHYPGAGITLHNEMRIPVGRPVDIHTGSRDVVHSFWVPRLGGKLDAIPGHTRVVRLQADQPGQYRGQCAEFCGLGHADMTMVVHAMAPAAFDAWLRSAKGTQDGIQTDAGVTGTSPPDTALATASEPTR